jgi:polar amino acid transport system substrate-binding protein
VGGAGAAGPGALTGRASVLIALALLLCGGGCASLLSDHARPELAATGRLRAALILSNPLLVEKDPSSGALRGVSVTLARRLAARLDVPFSAVEYANASALVDSFDRGEWDVAFFAYDPARAQQVAYAPAYMEVDNTYLVPAGSPITTVPEADRPGVRIGVPARSAPDLFLTRALRSAQLVRVPGGEEPALDLLRGGGADAYADNAHVLTRYAARLPGSRVLEDRYTVIRQAIATPRGRPFAANYVRRFIEDAKQDGTVAAAIREAGLHRVRVAPRDG